MSTSNVLIAGPVSAGMFLSAALYAADHKDSVAVDTRVSGDISDVYAFIDPGNTNNVVLMMAINPFTNPNENPGLHFEENYLYQFKIDNDQGNGALEDLVVQVEFDAVPDRGAQTYRIKLGVPDNAFRGPTKNVRLGDAATLCAGTAYNGAADASFAAAVSPCADGQVFVGVTDDAFQTDVAQYVFRIGLNPDPAANAANHTQDVPRSAVSSLFGALPGRPLRADTASGVNSGVDGFGGFNLGTLAISLPRDMLRGSGIPDASQNGAVNASLIGVWATVSRPKSEFFDGYTESGLEQANQHFHQFERMGQQLFNTVFGFQRPPFNPPPGLTAEPFGFTTVAGTPRTTGREYPASGALKDLINTTGPEDDVANYDYLVFDNILFSDLVAPTSFNTVEGRALLLTAGGFTAPGTGTPLLLPALAADSPLGLRKRALAELLLPDYLRLHLDLLPDQARPGAAAAANDDPVLGIGRWGVQNGRRPADDVTDIYVRLARETADVAFPRGLVIDNSGITNFPGSEPLGDRRALNCENLRVNGVAGDIDLLEPCSDARIFAVLQGTDWLEPQQSDVDDVTTQQQLLPLRDSFPYVAEPHPIPGEPGTAGFPDQHQDDVL